MKPNRPNRHSERSAAESRNLFFNRPLKLFRLLLALTFIAVGCEKKPTKSLHQAAHDGDIERVKSLISRGTDVNAKEWDGTTPLMIAEEKGHNEIVELLRKHGAKE